MVQSFSRTTTSRAYSLPFFGILMVDERALNPLRVGGVNVSMRVASGWYGDVFTAHGIPRSRALTSDDEKPLRANAASISERVGHPQWDRRAHRHRERAPLPQRWASDALIHDVERSPLLAGHGDPLSSGAHPRSDLR
jgi:hypothetical protein